MIRKRIAFVTLGPLTTFMRRDLDLLQRHADVRHVLVRMKLPHLLLDLLTLPVRARDADIVYVWFADIHAAVAVAASRLRRRPAFVAIGGYDAANVPEIGYGIFTYSRVRRLAARYVYRGATRCLAVDPSLIADACRNAGVSEDSFVYLPTGYDPEEWMPNGAKSPVVLTVCGIAGSVIRRKGLRTFVEAARAMPDTEFVLVGKLLDTKAVAFKESAPPNVRFTGFASASDLKAWYQKARVYCQLSRYEGLPNALCEAMLAGCIPVGTPHSGIPLAIGETGFIVPYGDVPATTAAIRQALSADARRGQEARERIIKLFPQGARESGLVRALEL